MLQMSLLCSLHELNTSLLICLNMNTQGQSTFFSWHQDKAISRSAAINWQCSNLLFFLSSERSVKQWFLLREQIGLQSLCKMRNSFRGFFHSYKLLLISKLHRNKYSVCSIKSRSSFILVLQFSFSDSCISLLHPHILNSAKRLKRMLNFKIQEQHYREQKRNKIFLPNLDVGFLFDVHITVLSAKQPSSL